MKETDNEYKYLKFVIDRNTGTVRAYQNSYVAFEITNDVFAYGTNFFDVNFAEKDEKVTILNPKTYPPLSYDTDLKL
jgi:hypothetical protein